MAESLARERGFGDTEDTAWRVMGLAGVAEQRGQAERAARLLGAAEALLELDARGWLESAIFGADRESILSAVRSQLDEEMFAAAWAEGRALATKGWERAIAYALGEDEG